MDQIARKHRGRADFVFAYGREAHPEDPYKPGKLRNDRQPISRIADDELRRDAARHLQAQEKYERRIVLDGLGEASALDRFFPGYDHAVLVIDVDGRIVFALGWPHAEDVDRFLQTHLDKNERP